MIATQTAPGLPIPAPARSDRFALPDQRPLIERVQTAMIEGARDPWVRDVAMSITKGMDWQNREAIALALLRWVQARIQYAEDTAYTDLVQRADYTLERRTGDCVAQSVLLGSLLIARGIPATALYQDPDGAGIGHVMILADVYGDGAGIALDPIDYARPVAYTPHGYLYAARGEGRATSLETAPMLTATTKRRSVGWSGVGRLAATRRAVGQLSYACNAYGGSGATQREGESDAAFAERINECNAEIAAAQAAGEQGGSAWDSFWASFGGALPGAILQRDKNGSIIYGGGGGGARPPAPPASATIMGLSPAVVVGILALLWLAFRARKKGK